MVLRSKPVVPALHGLLLAACGDVANADFHDWKGAPPDATVPATDDATTAPPPSPDGGQNDAADDDDDVPPPTPPADDGTCPADRKLCAGSCVARSAPAFGCGVETCAPACPAPANGKAVCKAGACAVACDSGFGICPTTGPDVCTPLETFFRDVDGDGYGSTTTMKACSAPAGYAGIGGDCHDGNPVVHPFQTTSSTTPYDVEGSTLKSFDYDCSGKEEASTAPSCDGLTCLGFADRDEHPLCVLSGPVTNRPPGAHPTCGMTAKRCIRNVSGFFEWVPYNETRPCR